MRHPFVFRLPNEPFLTDEQEETTEYAIAVIKTQGVITPGDLWDSWVDDILPHGGFQVHHNPQQRYYDEDKDAPIWE